MYGEQDFLNVHFAGRHTRLSLEYKCSAEKVASGEWPDGADACSILEFDSCTIGTGSRGLEALARRGHVQFK